MISGTWLAISCFFCAAAWAQAPPRQAQPETISHEAPATFSSRVNLVSVPVVVRDRDGHAIGGLQKEDFQLFDKGKPQIIAKFSVETAAEGPAIAGAAPVIAGDTVSANVPQDGSKPVLPSRYVAYLFDDVHMKVGDMLYARKSANQQLDRTLDANTRVGVFTTSGRTTQDFTNDSEKLHAAINRIQPWTPAFDKTQDCPPVTYYLADTLINRTSSFASSDEQILGRMQDVRGGDPVLSALYYETLSCLHLPDPATVKDPNERNMILQRVLAAVKSGTRLAFAAGEMETRTSLSVIADLVRSMSALPGARTIVMVSPGMNLAADHRSDENNIFEKAIRAGVRINTLDIRGVATLAGFEASEAPGPSSNAVAFAAMLRYDNDAATDAQGLLEELAAATGGTFFHNDNGIEEGLDQLAAQPEYTYLLSFSPDNLKFDGSYHSLKVTLKIDARVSLKSPDIEARRGYWAPNHSISPAEEAKEEIEEAVFSRDELRDVPVKLHTEVFKQSEAKAQITVETRADLQSLKFKRTEDRNRDTLTVVTGLFDENGRYVKGTETTLDMRLKDETLGAAQGPVRVSNVTFDVAPGRYVVRVVVRDVEGRSMAAENEGVEIP